MTDGIGHSALARQALAATQYPLHVAIIMDGNGRWARARFMPRVAGHRQGLESLRRCIRACRARDVGVLTVFAFSSENWQRPAEEVRALMDLMVKALAKEVPPLQQQGVRLHFVGAHEGIAAELRQGMRDAEAQTADNAGLILNVCFNYGGRWDIAQAAAGLQASGQTITEASLADKLALAHVRDPDLLIRTGGESRISNFLLWQGAYAELFFVDVLWPDFDESHLDAVLQAYASRERRFGQTSDQRKAASLTPPP